MKLAPGTVLQQRYWIEQVLGTGGMGNVYLARDVRLAGRRWAIKESQPDPTLGPLSLEQLRRQFEREANVLASLDHPNLPKVSDFFQEGGNAYLVMDHVEGTNLSRILARQPGQPVPEATVRAWALQVLDALDYLHSRRPHPVIHRDIKPANLILTPEQTIKLVDFGLVKLLDPNDPRSRTMFRGYGSPPYAPVEQYASQVDPVSGAPVSSDPRTDLYALGATIYHLATGFEPPDVHSRMLNPGSFVPPRERNAVISAALDAVIRKAMAVQPADRYPSAAAMRAALTAQPDRGDRRPLLLGAAAAVILVVMVGITGVAALAVMSRGSSQDGDDARSETGIATPVARGGAAEDPAALRTPATLTAPPATPVPSIPAATEPPRPTGAPPPAPTPAEARGLVAFSSARDGDDEIYLMREDGSGQTRLTFSPGIDEFPVLSPDGRSIAFVSNRDGNPEIYTIRTDGSDERRLTFDPGEDRLPAWSPDGARIAFNSNRRGDLDLYAISAGGGEATALTSLPGREGHAAWSPDGRRLAFNAGTDAEATWEILVMDLFDASAQALTANDVIDWSPNWSPDGRRLVFLSKRAGTADVFVMNADGGVPAPIYTGPGYEWGAVWSPDGSRIAFTSDQSGRDEVYVIGADGGGLRQLTTEGGSYPSWR